MHPLLSVHWWGYPEGLYPTHHELLQHESQTFDSSRTHHARGFSEPQQHYGYWVNYRQRQEHKKKTTTAAVVTIGNNVASFSFYGMGPNTYMHESHVNFNVLFPATVFLKRGG